MQADSTPGISIPDALKILRAADPLRLEALGFKLEPADFYSPVNNLAFLQSNKDLWSQPFVPLDIEWRVERQMRVVQEVSKYVHELAGIPEAPTENSDFHWNNNYWNGADALVQYGLLRSRKPRALIEIGCGFSSVLAARALTANKGEDRDYRPDVTLIEPYPNRDLLGRLPRDWRLMESMLQRCPLEWFDQLGAGDVLFYDGSHCARTASDVNWFFFRVLPRIRAGVIIHLHDIFLPFDYPSDWLLNRRQSWNEQFLLQAFLMHNPIYQVEIANAFIAYARPAEVKELYRGVQPFWGASFWMVKTRSMMPAAER